MNHKLIKDIKKWLAEYEVTFPSNLQIDEDGDMFDGAAYQLLGKCLKELEQPHDNL